MTLDKQSTNNRSQDDGPYTLIVENKFGKDEIAVKLLVTDPSGLDFRAMLKHRLCTYMSYTFQSLYITDITILGSMKSGNWSNRNLRM